MIELTDAEFHTIYEYVRRQYGLNLEKKKYLIESRLWIELAHCKVETYSEYWRMVRADASGVLERRMMDQLTTNYTFFCREEQHFAFLQDVVLPEHRAQAAGRPLSFWCAGCSTGQECYTLAMHLLDCRQRGLLNDPFSILGSDLSSQAVATARKGEYPSSEYARLSPEWQQSYCTPFSAGSFKVRPEVASYVSFEQCNLLEPRTQCQRFDVVLCRNVLIYFRDDARRRLIRCLEESVAPGGYLFVGHTESLMNCPTSLEYVQPAVYRKKAGGSCA